MKHRPVRDPFPDLLTHIEKTRHLSKQNALLICSLLYWRQHYANPLQLEFSTSDPNLLMVFLYFLRRACNIEESRLRPTLYLYEFQKAHEEIEFWAQITEIHPSQFSTISWKRNPKRQKRSDFHGCLTIKYYDCAVVGDLRNVQRRIKNLIGST